MTIPLSIHKLKTLVNTSWNTNSGKSWRVLLIALCHENGKIADSVILDKNLLENITYSRTLNGVIMNGIYYDSDKIDELKDFTQSISSSFHMNVKVFYSLISSPLVRLQFAD